MNIVPVVVSPLISDWKTQVAVLETLSTLAEIGVSNLNLAHLISSSLQKYLRRWSMMFLIKS